MRRFLAHRATPVVFAVLLLFVGLLLARTRLRADDPVSLGQIRCTLTFNDLTRPEEQEWVESILTANGADMEDRENVAAEVAETGRKIASSVTSESSGTRKQAPETGARVYVFTVNDPAALTSIHRALMAGRTGGPQPLFTAGEPNFAMTYSTPRLQGSLDVTVHFIVSPDAELFIKEQGGEEQSASSSIDRTTGHVDLPTQIRRGEEYILARTTRGDIQRYLKIDIYTGETTDIDRATYEH